MKEILNKRVLSTDFVLNVANSSNITVYHTFQQQYHTCTFLKFKSLGRKNVKENPACFASQSQNIQNVKMATYVPGYDVWIPQYYCCDLKMISSRYCAVSEP